MRSRQVSLLRRGGPDALTVRDGEAGVPGPGEVLVRVLAAGVSYGDLMLELGVIPGGPKPPFTPGYDVTGVVEQVGAGVRNIEAGQRVVALVRSGGYADHALVPARRLLPLPAGVDPVRCAAAVLNYFIAYQMLHRVAKVGAGQRILVHGASGGVGTAFLQLARRCDVECYGTASPAKHDQLIGYGAHPIDYRDQDFVKVLNALPEPGVHAAFDAIGGKHFNRSYSVLRRGGVMVGYGQSAMLVDGRPSTVVGARGFLGGIVAPKLLPDGRRTEFYIAWGLEKREPNAYREDLAEVLALLAEDKIDPLVAKVMSLDEAAAAQRLVADAAVTGKIVLTTGS